MNIAGNFNCTNVPQFSFKSSKNEASESKYRIPDAEQDVVQINNTEKTAETTKTEEVSKVQSHKRGINFDKLDKEKTYVGMQYGRRNRLARQIVRFTKKYCPESDVPAHIFALSYKDGDWWVHESHIMTKKEIGLVPGTHKLKADVWRTLGANRLAETDIYEADLDVDALDKNAGQPYGKGDMVKQLIASIFDFNGKQSDSNGLLCSEYLAGGMSDICEFYNLPTWAITPAHFKDYFVKTGAKQVNE